MPMYFVGIDISKYKHDCCIISAADQQIISKFTITNDKDGFEQLLTSLNSLSNPEDIKIGFESTAHYALNLELFLENAHHSFMQVNPVLIKEYKKVYNFKANQNRFCWLRINSPVVNYRWVQTPFKRILPRLFTKVTNSFAWQANSSAFFLSC